MRAHDLLSRLPSPLKSRIKDLVYPRPLPEGELIPEWHLQSHDGEWHRQGVHWTVMAFLPPCPDHPEVGRMLGELVAQHAQLMALGARVVVVMPAEAPELRRIADQFGCRFPLLTDRGSSVSRMFRAAIQLPMKPIVVPTLYLVNPDRKIRLANRGAPSIEAVVRSIQALQQATSEGR